MADACVLAADSSTPRIDTVTIAVAGPEPGFAGPSPWPFAGPFIERHLAAEPPVDCQGRPMAPRTSPPHAPFLVYSRGSEAILLGPSDSASPARVRFVRLPPARDERDVLDGSSPRATRVDVLVTRNTQTLEYARARPELVTRSLPWDRVYVLAASGAAVPDADARAALARDAVRADARGAESPFWWVDDPRCGGSGSRPVGSPIVAYAQGDMIARDLAERVVALAAMDRSPTWLGQLRGRALRSAPLPAASLDSSLRRGQASGVVAAWPLRAAEGCGGLAGTSAGAWAPLVDSRAHVVVRRGAPSLLIAADGTLLILVGSAR